MAIEKTVIIIPTYNESKTVKHLIAQIQKCHPGISILFVDDNSPDGTGEIIKNMIGEGLEGVHLLSRQKKEGIGSAYKAGLKQALDKKQFDHFLQMDADLSHNPDELKYILTHRSNYDLIIGSRYKGGMRVVNWSILRMMVSYLGNKYAKFITRMPIQDCTSGFTCINRKFLASIQIQNIHTNQYSFQIEYKYRAWLLGAKLLEVPITFKERKSGESKFELDNIREAFLHVLMMKLRLYRTKFKKKFVTYMNQRASENSQSSEDKE